jgi:hypothetical protein
MPNVSSSDQPKVYGNPLSFRKHNGTALIKEMQIFHKHMRDRYLIGLIHPDLAVKNGLSPKLYHDVPLPTSTIGVYGSYVGSTNASGNALISFATPSSPAILLSTGLSFYTNNITFNNSVGLTGTNIIGGNTFVKVAPGVMVPIQKYRLVSALIRVSYTGKLLDQSGKFYSCATYDALPTTVQQTGTVGTSQSALVDRFGDFSLIKNGLWNTTIDVTSPNHAIECLWVPTDNYNYIFHKYNTYGGTELAPPDTPISPSYDSSYLGYLIACQGLPVSTPCITVETWYNYEVIADPSAAPYMSHSVDDVWDQESHEKFSKAVSNEVKTTGLIREAKPNSSSGWGATIKSIADVGLPIITKLLSIL